MLVQLVVTAGRLKAPTFTFSDAPVLIHNPPLALSRMATLGPSKEAREERIFHLLEGVLTDDRGVVSAPADNQRVQGSD